MRRMVPVLAVALFLAVGCTSFKAELKGRNVVPPSDSVMRGVGTLDYNKHGGMFHHSLRSSGLKDITGATVHLIPLKGENDKEAPKVGPIVITLPVEPKTGVYAGLISQGS